MADVTWILSESLTNLNCGSICPQSGTKEPHVGSTSFIPCVSHMDKTDKATGHLGHENWQRQGMRVIINQQLEDVSICGMEIADDLHDWISRFVDDSDIDDIDHDADDENLYIYILVHNINHQHLLYKNIIQTKNDNIYIYLHL